MRTLEVSIMRLPGNEDLPLPGYQTEHAAGMDVHAAVPGDSPLVVPVGRIVLVPAGFAVAVPAGYEAQVRPRSGLASKQGLTLVNSPGTIDADYRGEVRLPMINLGPEPVTVTRGMRVAQMLIVPVPRVMWKETQELPSTVRGEQGFGHTGH